jgi:hypothetical protein
MSAGLGCATVLLVLIGLLPYLDHSAALLHVLNAQQQRVANQEQLFIGLVFYQFTQTDLSIATRHQISICGKVGYSMFDLKPVLILFRPLINQRSAMFVCYFFP